ncbi:MAG TPA: tyrosine--tRNA ligase [Candidatus Korarchaeota archaeon]|nr:tyrosine--tRNA ligase [Candidatus Korarchaeota archaeon]
MDVETRMELITRLPTEEVITPSELKELLETKETPIAYNGFEPSGLAHIGTGLITALKVRDLTDAGVKYILFLADWHAWVNRKLGGDLEFIRKASEYFKHVWISLGVDPAKVEFKLASEIADQDYWALVLKVAQHMSMNRAMRAMTIAGRTMKEELPLAAYFYPPMQVSDIFTMKVDICQLGMDQRRANILAREIGPKLGFWKPICVHHHLLMGLQGPKKMGYEDDEILDVQISAKMSKSIPTSAIFVHDSPEEIRKKIRGAFCPARDPNNPIMELVKYVIMRDGKTPLTIERPQKYGGEITFESYKELEKAFVDGNLHPLDLKNAVAEVLIKILEPCRKHFEQDREAKELLNILVSAEITR